MTAKQPVVCVQCGVGVGLYRWNGVAACEDCIRNDIRDTDQIEDAIDEYIDRRARMIP